MKTKESPWLRKSTDWSSIPQKLEDYKDLESQLDKLPESDKMATFRYLCEHDLYFMLRYVLSTRTWVGETNLGKMKIMEHPYIFGLARDVQVGWEECDVPTFHACFRAGCKSTSVFGLVIQTICRDPEEVIGIFSARKNLAEKHLSRIKIELETNRLLKSLFSHVLYEDPASEAAEWSLTRGLTVKRKSVRMEPSIFSIGFLNSQATGSHCTGRVYDDIEDPDTISTPESREKVWDRYKASLFLSDTLRRPKDIIVGTYYHDDGPYRRMERQNIVKSRRRPAVEGVPDPGFEELGGKSVFLSPRTMLEMRRKYAGDPRWWGRQMLLDIQAGVVSALPLEKVGTYYNSPKDEARGKNIYLLCDPSGALGDSQGGDETCLLAVGLGFDKNVYIIDGEYRPMNPTERVDSIIQMYMRMHKWSGRRPAGVRIERAGQNSDVHWLRRKMEDIGYRFQITDITRSGPVRSATGSVLIGKTARHESAIFPLIDQERLFVPKFLYRKGINIIESFLSEIASFPNNGKDHFLDALSLLFLEPDKYGEPRFPSSRYSGMYDRIEGENRQTDGRTWMTA